MNMKMHKLTNVFGTSREVPQTYVERQGIDDRFLNDITRNKHIVIHGSSKQGKTCLRRHHLKDADYIVVQCTRETTKVKLYEMLLKNAGIQCEVGSTNTTSGGCTLQVKVGGEGQIPFITKATAEGTGSYQNQATRTSETKEFSIDPEDPNDIARVLNKANFSKYIVIEDFHYLDEKVQRSFSVDLKVFHENSGLIFLIIGVWLEANKLTLYNGDLSGRLAVINADRWDEEDLMKVILEGERLLNITFPHEVKKSIVNGCQSNVGLLQEVIYRICETHKIWQTQPTVQEVGKIDDVHIVMKSISDEQASRYRNFLSRFAEGLRRGEAQLEIYKWLLYAVINSNPFDLRRGVRPNVIFQRIKAVHPSNKLQQLNIVQALERVQEVQFRNKLQPLVLDYSNNELLVVDANFIVFVQTHSKKDLMEYIGLDLTA